MTVGPVFFQGSVPAPEWLSPPDSFVGHVFGDRIKLLRLTPEPKRAVIGVLTRKGKLGPAAEKFYQCAKEAFSKIR